MLRNAGFFLIVPPEQIAEGSAFPATLVHPIYRLGTDGSLLRLGAATPHGGLMLLGGTFPQRSNPQTLLRKILHQIRLCGYQGLVLDPEGAVTPLLRQLVPLLEDALSSRNLRFFLPEAYAPLSRTATVLLSSALSGGSLNQRIEETAARLAPRPLALSLSRVREVFSLPAPEGRGSPLSAAELTALLRRLHPNVYTSAPLCARYFTYLDRDNRAHFVLFDDGETLVQKVRLGLSLSIRDFFLAYPEITDVARDFFSAFPPSLRQGL